MILNNTKIINIKHLAFKRYSNNGFRNHYVGTIVQLSQQTVKCKKAGFYCLKNN